MHSNPWLVEGRRQIEDEARPRCVSEFGGLGIQDQLLASCRYTSVDQIKFLLQLQVEKQIAEFLDDSEKRRLKFPTQDKVYRALL